LKDKLKKDDFVVVVFHDHGSRYVGKIYNDEWMLDRGFLDVNTVKDLIGGLGRRRLVTIGKGAKVTEVLELMKKYDIEQIPVEEQREMIGSVTQQSLFKRLLEEDGLRDKTVADIMEKPLPVVEMNTQIDRLTKYINKENGAVLAKDESGDFHILTKYDVLNALGK
jgi:cystathionine beta-synthase